MNEQEEKKPRGRPPEYEGSRKPVTTLWPEDILAYIRNATDNRTKWLIEAAREKIAREREQS